MPPGERFAAWLEAEGFPVHVDSISQAHIEGFIAAPAASGADSTANQDYRSLQQLWKWLIAEQEVTSNPFDRMRPPKMEQREIPVIANAALLVLLKATEGTAFED